MTGCSVLLKVYIWCVHNRFFNYVLLEIKFIEYRYNDRHLALLRPVLGACIMDRIPVLVVIEGPLSGQRFPLQDGDGNTIGRSEECAITINDPDVSRQHARVLLHNDTVFVQDDNSRNGVFVNEKRVVRKPEELRPGGKIVWGTCITLGIGRTPCGYHW